MIISTRSEESPEHVIIDIAPSPSLLNALITSPIHLSSPESNQSFMARINAFEPTADILHSDGSLETRVAFNQTYKQLPNPKKRKTGYLELWNNHHHPKDALQCFAIQDPAFVGIKVGNQFQPLCTHSFETLMKTNQRSEENPFGKNPWTLEALSKENTYVVERDQEDPNHYNLFYYPFENELTHVDPTELENLTPEQQELLIHMLHHMQRLHLIIQRPQPRNQNRSCCGPRTYLIGGLGIAFGLSGCYFTGDPSGLLFSVFGVAFGSCLGQSYRPQTVHQ